MAGDVLKQCPENETGDWVEIAGKGITVEAQRFKGDSATTGKGIHHQRRFTWMGGIDEGTACIEIGRYRRVVPDSEVGDEAHQRAAQATIGCYLVLPFGWPAMHRQQSLTSSFLEAVWALRVAWIW